MDLKANLNYAKDEGAGMRPYYYNYPPGEEEKEKRGHTGQFRGGADMVEVTVHDARQRPDLSLDKNSFEMREWDTALDTEDFYTNKQKVVEVYYKEMEELFKKATGAERVKVWHHQVRNSERNNASAETGTNSSVQPYAPAIHSDTHPQHSKEFFGHMVSGLEPRYQKGRFLYINAWRNISDEPIVNDHLAVLDETSTVKPDDYIVADFFDRTYGIQQYKLVSDNSHMHKWYYYPQMKKNEVILFKQWDSDPLLTGRMCFHTAFHDDSAPSKPTRQSVECRGFAFFPDHKPNTCPDIERLKADAKARNKEALPRAGDAGRVVTKNLFNFQLSGCYVDSNADQIEQTKAAAEPYQKLLASLKDQPDKFVERMDAVSSFIEMSINNHPFYKDIEKDVDHQQVVPTIDDPAKPTKIHVYQPKKLDGQKSPAILYVLGQGGLFKPVGQNKLGSALASVCGVRVFAPETRLVRDAPFPAPVEDLYATLKWLINSADSYSVDPNKICVLGAGIGGHMATSLGIMLAQKKETNLIKLLLPVSPGLDNSAFGDLSFLSEEEIKAADIAQATWNALAGGDGRSKVGDPLFYPGLADKELLALFPPTVVFISEFDKQYTSGVAFARKLNLLGRLLELVVQPGADENSIFRVGEVLDQYMDILKTTVLGYLTE